MPEPRRRSRRTLLAGAISAVLRAPQRPIHPLPANDATVAGYLAAQGLRVRVSPRARSATGSDQDRINGAFCGVRTLGRTRHRHRHSADAGSLLRHLEAPESALHRMPSRGCWLVRPIPAPRILQLERLHSAIRKTLCGRGKGQCIAVMQVGRREVLQDRQRGLPRCAGAACACWAWFCAPANSAAARPTRSSW